MERIEAFLSEPDDKVTYRVGEAPGDKVYKDLKATPKVVVETTAMLASNAAHLARLLNSNTYSGMRAALLAKLTRPASRRASTSRQDEYPLAQAFAIMSAVRSDT